VRSLPGYKVVEHIVLEHDDPKACNSADCPNQVAPHNLGDAVLQDGRLTAILPKLSWNVIRMARVE
jgi:alpha-N-arabinofuranosidase